MLRRQRLVVLLGTLAPLLALAAPAGPAPSPAGEGAAPAAPPAARADVHTESQEEAGQTRVEAVGPGGAARPAGEAVDLRVRTLEERVNDLKERIFRTKARLLHLQELAIGGDVASGARTALVHRNEMGGAFVLESVSYSLDGAPVFTRVDQDGDLDKREELEVFNGRLPPGLHQLAVKLTYRGHGYGAFSYLEGYRFNLESSHTFAAEAGKVTTVRVVGYEKGGVTAELKDRPGVRYDVETRPEERRPAGARGGAEASPAAPAGGGAR